MGIDPTLLTVLAGTAILGLVSGCLGTFAVLRRQSLLGDAASHAALPGIIGAFLLFGREPGWLLLGAIGSGLLAMVCVNAVTRTTRIPFDAALAGSLAVFFGLGLMLLSLTRKTGSAGIERYLFGQAAIMLSADVRMIAITGSAALLLLALFWKQFKIVSFDRQFAAGLGWRVVFWDLLLTCLIVTGIVIGLESVGVVLMSALIVAPAAIARQLTNRLGVMTVLAGLFGMASCVLGVLASQWIGGVYRNVSMPTGPTIVLVSILLMAITSGLCRIASLRSRGRDRKSTLPT